MVLKNLAVMAVRISGIALLRPVFSLSNSKLNKSMDINRFNLQMKKYSQQFFFLCVFSNFNLEKKIQKTPLLVDLRLLPLMEG